MGEPIVHMGGMVMCSFGLAPASIIVPPASRVMVESTPAANILCSTPANIPTFGMCTSLANPTVAAATAAALGVLTPMPCVPALTPWTPGSAKTMIGGQPALVMGNTCQCAFGGAVQILFPGAVRTTG